MNQFEKDLKGFLCGTNSKEEDILFLRQIFDFIKNDMKLYNDMTRIIEQQINTYTNVHGYRISEKVFNTLYEALKHYTVHTIKINEYTKDEILYEGNLFVELMRALIIRYIFKINVINADFIKNFEYLEGDKKDHLYPFYLSNLEPIYPYIFKSFLAPSYRLVDSTYDGNDGTYGAGKYNLCVAINLIYKNLEHVLNNINANINRGAKGIETHNKKESLRDLSVKFAKSQMDEVFNKLDEEDKKQWETVFKTYDLERFFSEIYPLLRNRRFISIGKKGTLDNFTTVNKRKEVTKPNLN